jgi:hypothetical protein
MNITRGRPPLHHLLEARGGRVRHAADAAEAVRHARAGLLLEDVPEDLAGPGGVEEGRERAELHRHGAVAHEVIAHARELAQDHPVVLAALRDRHAEHLLHREREAHVVEHRRDVVEAVDVREALRPRAALAHLLEAAVQVPDLHVGLRDRLAGQLQHDAHGAVHRRVRRPHVELHRLAGELQRGLLQLFIQRFHQFASPFAPAGPPLVLTSEPPSLDRK